MRAIHDNRRTGIELRDGTFIGVDRSARVRHEREAVLRGLGFDELTPEQRADAEREIREAIAIQTEIARSRALSGVIELGEA